METKDIVRDLRLPGISRSLLNRLSSKELSIDDFLRECAYWSIKDGFDGLRPRQLPQMPAKALEFENMPLSQRLKIDCLKFYAEFPQVKEYYEQRLFILHHNQGSLDWLRDMKKYIPESDTETQMKIDNRICDFRAGEDEFNALVDSVKSVFEAEIV
jgi:hypothetical protein